MYLSSRLITTLVSHFHVIKAFKKKTCSAVSLQRWTRFERSAALFVIQKNLRLRMFAIDMHLNKLEKRSQRKTLYSLYLSALGASEKINEGKWMQMFFIKAKMHLFWTILYILHASLWKFDLNIDQLCCSSW